MDWRQFTASIVKSVLSWPVAAVIIALLLLNPLDRVIDYADTLTYRDVKISFGKKIVQIKKDAIVSIPDINPQSLNNVEKFYQLAALSPATAVMESWSELESAASERVLAHSPDVQLDLKSPYKHMEALLGKYNIATVSQIKIFHDLRVLRNKVVHAPQFEISREQSIEYVDLALSLAKVLSNKN